MGWTLGRAVLVLGCLLASVAMPAAAEWDVDWRLGGNLQADALVKNDLPDGRSNSSELRRARLGGQLVLADSIRFSASGDFAEGARLRDLFVEIRALPQYVAIGRFPEPFGLAAQESSRAGLMPERPQPTAIVPGYGLGLAVNMTGTDWGLTAGVFAAQGELSDEDALKGQRKEDAISVRYTSTFFRSASGMVHLGFSLSDRRPKAQVVRFVAIPETVLLKGMQVSSGLVPVDEEIDDTYLIGGFEFAAIYGPLLLQSELMLAALPQVSFDERNDYEGGYVEAAWVLTGERRPYSTRRGVFGPVTPAGPWDEGTFGAWEVAARFSYTDFSRNPFDDFDEFDDDDDIFGSTGVYTGGRSQIVSLGLNWYPTALSRVTLNGLRIEKKRDDEREQASAVQLRVYLQFDLPRDD